MKHDLLGYVLNLLDDEDRRQVEAHLAESPEARRQVQALRGAVLPLGHDQEEEEGPAGLFVSTLKRVAAYRCRRVKAPPPPPSRGSVRSGWRLVDVLVAASILLVGFMIAAPAILYARHRYNIVACADNLHHFHAALMQYSQGRDANGYLPGPDRSGAFSAAGTYAVALRDAGCWDPALHPVCPANRKSSAQAPLPPTREQLKSQCASVVPTSLDSIYESLGGCYGYNLGFEDAKGWYHHISRALGDEVPIMADRPLRSREAADWQTRNSLNHAGTGQNVLFLGGHVRFHKDRRIAGDDLFLNANRRLAAGRGPHDAVLGPGEARPYPDEE